MSDLEQNPSKSFSTITIALLAAGLCVMILGIGLAYSYDPTKTATAIGTPVYPNDITLFLPVIVGGLLTFVGGVRMSLLLRPWKMIVLGSALVVTTVLGPPIASTYVPALREFPWTGAIVVPLFIARMLGIVFSTTGILRLLSRRGPTA